MIRSFAGRIRPLLASTVTSLLLGCEAPQPETPSYPQATREPIEPWATAPRSVGGARDLPFVENLAPEPKTRPSVGSDEKLTFEFRATPYVDALKLISDKSGASFVFPSEIPGTITATLRDVTLDQALGTVLDEGQLTVVDRGGVLNIEPSAPPTTTSRIYRPRRCDVTTLEPQLKTLLGEGAASITPDSGANVLFLTASDSDMQRADAWIRAVDAATQREILIEARLLEVSLDTNHEFGVGLAFQDISIGEDITSRVASNFLTPADDFQVTILDPTSDFSSVVRALQEYGKLHVIASPRVLALNQSEARIEITEKVPYVDSTATSSGSATGVSTSTVEEVEFEIVGIKLQVTPTLGENDQITLKVHQEVSEVVDFFNDVPVTDTRLIDTKFVARDRETIVIGGLMKERTVESETGIPMLMDIPLIGFAFRSTTTIREKVELLIFLTPHIVEPADVRGISSEFKGEFIRKNFEYGQPEYKEQLDDVR